jgi:hypothetical protein
VVFQEVVDAVLYYVLHRDTLALVLDVYDAAGRNPQRCIPLDPDPAYVADRLRLASESVPLWYHTLNDQERERVVWLAMRYRDGEVATPSDVIAAYGEELSHLDVGRYC